MPEITSVPRTRKVSTTTTEELPIDAGEGKGLGMPWQEYLATVPEDELAITTIYIYRKDPPTIAGFLYRSGGDGKPAERIDDQWLEDHFGGGTFDLTIRSKSGKSHYERTVKIAGLPKLTDKEKTAPSTPPPAAAATMTADNTKILELLERTIERVDRLQAGTAQPSPAQDKALEIVADAAKMAVGIAGSQGKPQEDSLERDLQRLKLMKEIFQPQAPPQDDMEKAFKQAMIKKLLDPPPTANKSLIEELKGLAELRDLMGWSEAGTGKEHWTTALIHQAPAVLDRLAGMNDVRLETERTRLRTAEVVANARRGQAPPAAQTQPVQTSANAAPNPNARATSRTPGPAPAAGPLNMAPMGAPSENGTAAPPPEMPPPSMDTESPAFVQFVKERVVAMVEAGEPGGGIVAFLAGNQQGQLIQMLVRYTPDQIASFLRNDATLRRAVENPDWPDILQEARDYIQEQQSRTQEPGIVQ